MMDLIQSVMAWPVYRYGLLFFALISVIPAIVSANMVQHLITKIIQTPNTVSQHFIALLFNLVVCLVCATIIYFALRTYITN